VKAHGGALAATPAEAARDAKVVFLCVGNDADVRTVSLGEKGVLAGMAKGAVLVDHTTASAALARELESAAVARGIGFIDAPVSGGQAGAQKGILTVMCGGAPEPFALVRPLIESYARAVMLMGPAGAGQLTKMVNQICIAGLVQGLAEGVHFAKRAGLDPARVFEVISKGAAQSWQMENRAGTMAEGRFDFGFAVDWMRKDLAICLAEAGRNSASLPVAALVDQFYAEIQAMGGQRWDTSSLVARLERKS
jgi:2-hydroxy-3-oxopropionate reductase